MTTHHHTIIEMVKTDLTKALKLDSEIFGYNPSSDSGYEYLFSFHGDNIRVCVLYDGYTSAATSIPTKGARLESPIVFALPLSLREIIRELDLSVSSNINRIRFVLNEETRIMVIHHMGGYYPLPYRVPV